MGIFIALLIFSFLIFFHELGHFMIARFWNVKVEVFSIGFGKRLFTKKIGDTEWSLSMIPLGGYVKMKGQDDSDPRAVNYDSDSYSSKTPWQRITILLAGPIANLLLAFLLYMGIASMGIPKVLPIVGELDTSLPASTSGMKKGDTIVEINGIKTIYWEDLSRGINSSSKEPISITVLRNHKYIYLNITPTLIDDKNRFGEPIKRKVIGIKPKGEIKYIDYSFTETIAYAYNNTKEASLMIVKGIQKLISGAIGSDQVSSVIGITDMISKATDVSFVYLLFLTALISVNLGILNLLPIPALDGGHIVFNLYEIIRRKAPSEEMMFRLTLIGWGFLLSIMLLGVYNDINRMLLG